MRAGGDVTLALLALGLAAGMLVRRRDWLGGQAPQAINAFIIHGALPAMILLRVPDLVLDATALLPVLSAWLVVLVCAGLVLLAARVAHWDRRTAGALLLVVPLTNSAYLGLPLVNVAYGHAAVPYAIMYDQFGTFMALSIYATIVIAVMSADGKPPSVRKVAWRIVTFTPFATVLIALLLGNGWLPQWSLPPLQWLAASMGPLAMFVIGLQLQFTVHGSLRRKLAFALVVKLAVAPLLALALILTLGVRGPAAQATLLQAAMPPMITAALFGINAGFSTPLIVAVIGVVTVASVLSLPAWYWVGLALA